ncbi:head-tail connector protein [Mesorhizobium sp. NZP2298]|uniref:head-tail connector protein n=1 Tax=Mesorhizobium sp. NZP2298 TaxID=2483403 RepID=UPI0015577166|nr:head-tail connector protein [Mesorhizobium sp. NZP2298]QKC99184.1 phage gp6-like head-tail connector protein [Mesorhizobium sp. NZP2298]
MSLLDIDLVKKHLRLDFLDDDDTIAAYQAAAETIVTEYVDREVYAEGGEPSGDDGTAIEVTPAITAAVLLLVGDLYENREADPESKGDAVLPRAVRALLAPYRVWRTIDVECA